MQTLVAASTESLREIEMRADLEGAEPFAVFELPPCFPRFAADLRCGGLARRFIARVAGRLRSQPARRMRRRWLLSR